MVADVLDRVLLLAERAVKAGVDPDRIVIDPAHDFGKNTWQSLEITRRLSELTATGFSRLSAVECWKSNPSAFNVPRCWPVNGSRPSAMSCANSFGFPSTSSWTVLRSNSLCTETDHASLKWLADETGNSMPTVSRAVDDKWVQTPRGIFSLKRFFGGGTTTTDGEEVAWDTIKQKLLEIIAKEDKSNPLSDEDLVSKLQESGYPVARRTVTKYRKMLNIPSSRQRKDWTLVS